jgi:hypothetical protein
VEAINLPLGATPVLDKGYVLSVSSSPNGNALREIRAQIYRGVLKEGLADIPRVVLKVRCPLVVLHSMMATKLRIIQDPYAIKDDVHEPQVTDIRSGKLETDTELAEYMAQTLNALVLNQTTLKEDGCDGFVASLTTPIAAYWEGLVYGDLSDWIRVIVTPGAPRMIKSYQDAFRSVLSAEFLDLDEMIKRVKP